MIPSRPKSDPRSEVVPYSGRLESTLIGSTIAIVLVICLCFALSRPTETRISGLTDWQLNAFDDLGPADRSIHSSLVSAAEEIQMTQQTLATWLTIAQLKQFLIPPFYEDAFWRANGEVAWEMETPPGKDLESAQGTTFYFGHGGKAAGQSAYLIVQRHSHAGYNSVTAAEIWLHPNPNVVRPADQRQASLIRNGWRQVVSYSGAQEAKRIH